MTGKHRWGRKEAEKILTSGKALKKMNEIIKAQGKLNGLVRGEHSYIIKSSKKGKVKAINNETISKIARIAGAPKDKGSGLYLHKKVKDKVSKGEPLYTIYAENKFKLNLAKDFAKKNKGFTL